MDRLARNARVAAGVPKATVARDLGISRETLYKYLRTSTTDVEGNVETTGLQSRTARARGASGRRKRRGDCLRSAAGASDARC